MMPQLSRYYSVIVPVAIVAASLLTYQIYLSTRTPNIKRLKRSNARRVSRRNPRRFGSVNGFNSSEVGGIDSEGNALSDERLREVLDQGTIDIPDSMADTLVEAAVAAREARGAGGGIGPDDLSEYSYAPEPKENQNLLNLLYLIAEEQSKRDSYVHRGVTCNACNCLPIRGIRYRCANCIDFDLCETCEALDSHPKTHLFYKVRIPAPFLGNPRQAQTPWYPGKTGLMSPGLPADVVRKFGSETGFEPPEVEALYEQFKCLAASEYVSDPLGLGGAISRQTFDKCFVPNTHVRPPPPNLIYDRMFAFYDTNNDGLIGFEEFVRGLSTLNHKNRAGERLRRVFNGYDLDGDGYVDRKDFLRIFRAFYALSKDLVKDMVASMEDDHLEANQASSVLVGSQPISAAFAGNIPPGTRRSGKGGDSLEEDDDGGDDDDDDDVDRVVLPSGDDRSYGPGPSEVPTKREKYLLSISADAAPVVQARRREEERRRAFFDISSSPPGSSASASSSHQIPDPEKDVGSEILYQITQQGLNELLDLLFIAKEQLAIQAREEQDEDTPAKKEVEARGGEGKLSFEEFEKIMKAKRGVDLSFVGTWIDMANF